MGLAHDLDLTAVQRVDLEHELIERACLVYEHLPADWILWEGVRVHTWASRFDRQGTPDRWSICELIGRLAMPIIQASGGKDDLALWSPTHYREGTQRGSRNVELVTMLVLDVDDGTGIEKLVRPNTLCLAHTSWSHTAEHPKWRVIYPLSEPVSAKDWAGVWRWAAQQWPIDPSTKDAARMFYVPALPCRWDQWSQVAEGSYQVAGANYQVRMQFGALLQPQSVDEPKPRAVYKLPSYGPVPKHSGNTSRDRYVTGIVRRTLERLASAVQGGRNNRAYGAAKDLARLRAAGSINWEEVYPSLMAAALASGLGEKEAASAIESGRKEGWDEPWQFD